MTRSERQKLAVQKWISAGCRGTLSHPTGFGKTREALAAIKLFLSKNKGKTILIVVPTEYLKLQWMQELGKNNLFHEVTVEIVNSAIKKHEKVDFLVIDEVHRVPADTFFTVFKERDPSIVLGLSATFNRLDGKHELLRRYCPVCDVITINEAVNNKWLSSYREYKVVIEPEDIADYRYYNQQFNETFSFFNYDFQLAMKCLTNIIYRRTYGKGMGMKPAEVDAIVFTWNRMLVARKQYVMNHPKKIEITRKILDARPNKKAITFSATIKQAEAVGRGYLIHSGKTKKKNRITFEEFNRMPTGVINTAKSLNEGADLKGLSLAIILCNTSSQVEKTQRIGRVIRFEEGKEAEIFTLVIAGTNEEAWFNTSSAGKSYIEITELELEEVLAGREIDSIKKEAVESDLLFRF